MERLNWKKIVKRIELKLKKGLKTRFCCRSSVIISVLPGPKCMTESGQKNLENFGHELRSRQDRSHDRNWAVLLNL